MTGDPRFGTEHPAVILNALPAALGVGSWAFTITFYKHKQRPTWEGKVCSPESEEEPRPHCQETWATSWGWLEFSGPLSSHL